MAERGMNFHMFTLRAKSGAWIVLAGQCKCEQPQWSQIFNVGWPVGSPRHVQESNERMGPRRESGSLSG